MAETEGDAAVAPAPSAPSWPILALAWFLGLVFVFSAVAKVLSLGAFEVYVVQQGLAPSREVAAYAVRALLAAELFLGLACFVRARFRQFTLPASFGMLLGFSAYLAYLAFVKKDGTSCHCFGELLPMSPLHSLLKNLALMGIVLFLHVRTRAWPPGSWRVPAVVGVASLMIVGLGFPVRHVVVEPVPSAAPPPVSPFAQFREFDGRPADLTVGFVLVAFVSLDCEHCQALVTRLGEVSHEQVIPPVYLICYGTADDVPIFLTETGSDFPAACVEPGVFFNFVGDRPPRLYLVEDGHARAMWDEETFDPQQLSSWWQPPPADRPDGQSGP